MRKKIIIEKKRKICRLKRKRRFIRSFTIPKKCEFGTYYLTFSGKAKKL